MTGKDMVIFFVAMLAVLYVGYLFRKISERREYFNILLKVECKYLYFHGYRLSRYLLTGAFGRLQQWLDDGDLSNGLAILAMIILRDDPTTVFYQGMRLENDEYKSSHSWVEFKIPLNGIWVADFSLGDRCFYRKKEYRKLLNANDIELIIGYKVEHDDFWNTLPLAEIAFEKMYEPETSNLLSTLLGFRCPADGGWLGFSDIAYEPEEYYTSDELKNLGVQMAPFYCGSNVISTEIIRDFAKRERRKQPKERSKRITMKKMKHRIIMREDNIKREEVSQEINEEDDDARGYVPIPYTF